MTNDTPPPPDTDWDRVAGLLAARVAHELPARRWFAGKGRPIARVLVRDLSPPVPELGDARFAVLQVEYADGAPKIEHYNIPVVLPNDGSEPADAAESDPFAANLPRWMLAGSSVPGRFGRFLGAPTRLGAAAQSPPEPLASAKAPAVRRGSAEQSNTNLVVDDARLVKLFRSLHLGPNPDAEIGAFLADRGFPRVPPTLARALYQPDNSAIAFDLAILQAFVPNRGDAWRRWTDALAELHRDPAPLVSPEDSRLAPHRDAAARLGRVTAELHLALASDTRSPDFRPEPLETRDLDRVRAAALERLREARDRLRSRPAPDVPGTPSPLELLDALEPRLAPPAPADSDSDSASHPPLPPCAKFRVHGDYHLGQLLVTPDDDYVVVDFEGEPMAPLDERRAKASPLKDIAGMARSFHYAATASLFAARDAETETDPNPDPDRARIRENAARLWLETVDAAFLDRYRETLDSTPQTNHLPLVPRDPAAFRTLLDAHILEKALYELVYELSQRPDWARIPLQGLREVLQRSKTA